MKRNRKNVSFCGAVSPSVMIAAVILAASPAAHADERATTPDGREVILNDSGTWSYVDNAVGDRYREIDFVDFMIDAKSLDGQKVRLRATGGFRNNNNSTHPSGSVYKKTFTIGPAIQISTKNVDRASLRVIHECPLNCVLEVSGTVGTSGGSSLINAMEVKVISRL